MSGFYYVEKENVPEDVISQGAQGVLSGMAAKMLYESGSRYYLQTQQYPHPMADALGAVPMGESWQDFWDAAHSDVRDGVFLAEIVRDGVRRKVRRVEIQDTDQVRRAAIPPHRFSGDSPVSQVRTGGS